MSELNPIEVDQTINNGEIEAVHLAPIGEFVGSDREGNAVNQTIDVQSLTNLANKLNQGDEVLVDVDHQSAKQGVQKNTKAAGWLSRFFVDPVKGLFAKLKLTRFGRDLIENREYRYFSPAFLLNSTGRPIDMMAASLTNMPAFKGSIDPIINQQPKDLIIMEMTKDELVDLIKSTVVALNAEPEKKDEACNDEPDEKTDDKVDETQPDDSGDTVNSVDTGDTLDDSQKTLDEETDKPIVEDQKILDETDDKPEDQTEEPKDDQEVIKLESLNTQAVKSIADDSEWKHLHGQAFFDYCKTHNLKIR